MSDSNTAEVEVEAGSVISPVALSQLDSSKASVSGKGAKELNLKMILDVPVDIHVELGSTRVSIREVLRMGAGSIIEMDRLAGAPADIIANGKLIGNGDVVVVNDNFGIRIAKLVDPEDRIESL